VGFSHGVPAKFYGVLGRAEWFPWAAPALLVSLDGAPVGTLPAHSLVVVLIAFLVGTMATFAWWRGSDQAR